MDLAMIIGIPLAFGALIAMTLMEGGHLSSLILLPPMILVFGGSFAAAIAQSTIPDIVQAMKAVPGAALAKPSKPQATIDQMVTIAERARKDGLLALEQEAEGVKDPFTKKALQNIADGTDAEDLRTMLEDEMATREKGLRADAKFWGDIGGYAPTVGILGTVVSLTHVLENLSEPDELGHMIAAAFVATLWGVLSANFLFLPLSGRLGRLADLEVERMTLVMEGVLAVQSGSQPRMLGERLKALVPVHQQPKAAKSAAKAA